jgi:hypothetical protein
MPHRLKTPRWYKKRKIQIQNMDIWNVAFPEGAVIDPNTAWKVFWKTAASMYGTGGFRKRWIDWDEWSHMYGETYTSGYYCTSTQPNFCCDDYIENHKCRIKRESARFRDSYRYLSYGVDNDSIENSKGLSYHQFVHWTVNGTRPGLVHVGVRRVSSYGADSEPHNCWRSRTLDAESIDKHWRDYVNLNGNVQIQETGELEKFYIWFSPETFGYSGSDYLNINWDRWWEKVEAGNEEAFTLSNLLWCDWLLTRIRPLIECSCEYGHHPIEFVFPKVADVWFPEYLKCIRECRQEILCQFLRSLPVRPLDY